MLFGMGKHKGLIWMRLTEALGTAGLGILLMRFWGLWGYALATTLVAVAINLVLIPRYACKVLNVSLIGYLAKGFFKPCLFSLPMAATMAGFAYFFPSKNWTSVITGITCGSLVYILTLMAATFYSQDTGSQWWSLGVFELLRRRFLKREKNLEFSATGAVLNSLETTEEQSVAQ
jgi:hypothetical protein